MSLLELNDVIQRNVLHLVVNHLSRIVLQPQFLSVQVSFDDLLASGAFCAQLSDESLLRDIEGSLAGRHVVDDIVEDIDAVAQFVILALDVGYEISIGVLIVGRVIAGASAIA